MLKLGAENRIDTELPQHYNPTIHGYTIGQILFVDETFKIDGSSLRFGGTLCTQLEGGGPKTCVLGRALTHRVL